MGRICMCHGGGEKFIQYVCWGNSRRAFDRHENGCENNSVISVN